MRRAFAKTAVALGASILMVACGDDGGTGSSGEPTLTVELTDAPGDLAHAWVEIEEISLTGGTESGGPVLLDEPTGLIDLLTLAGTTAELIRDVAIPAGSYGQMRLVVGAAIIEAEDGRVFATPDAVHPEGKEVTGELRCPSCTQSGLKINFRGGLQLDSEAKVVVLDFDVSQSFGRERGNSGRWVMSPVIMATEVGLSGAATGTVSLADGVTLPTCGGAARTLADFVPSLESDEGTHNGHVDTDGAYSIGYVAPGSYEVGYEAMIEFESEVLTFTASPSVADVTIESGQSAEIDFAITAAECGATTE